MATLAANHGKEKTLELYNYGAYGAKDSRNSVWSVTRVTSSKLLDLKNA